MLKLSKNIRKNNIKNRNHSKFIPLIIVGFIILMALFYTSPFMTKSQISNSSESSIIVSTSPTSKPLSITQHAIVVEDFLSPSIPTNVSFTLVEDWVSKNTTILFEGISNRKDWVTNGSFNSSLVPWKNLTTSANMQITGWNPAGYASINLPGGAVIQNDYAYYFENISIPELFTNGKLISVSLKYLYQGGPQTPTMIQMYIAIEIDGKEKNQTTFFPDLVKGIWTPMSFTYDPASVGQQIPDNLILKVGLRANNSGIVLNAHQLHIDDVELKLWTQPNRSNLIYVEDPETGYNYTYQNSDFGNGMSFIGAEKSYAETENVIFTIHNNMTNIIDIEVFNITIMSNLEKLYNSTIDGIPGSVYSTNGLIKWQVEWEIDFPSTYLNSWINIEKPIDWNITKILDGYDVERTGQCPGTNFGSEILNIPTSIVRQGLWILEAESYNYINDGYISLWNGSSFKNETNLYLGDIFQISVVLNNSVSILNTQINCTIKYPNSTIFLQESQQPSSHTIIFGNYSVGNNMSIGKYQVLLEWVNDFTIYNRDKVGFRQLELNIIHKTNLTAVEPYIEKIAGVPTLIKVKFQDFDLNMTIPLAEVTYNTTYGASGNMAYIGSGIYMAELYTASLDVGDYYLSFNASKAFYQNHSITNLVQLRIRPESLILRVPRQVKSVMANSDAYYEVNVTGEVSGLFLSPANITLDWARNYTVKDFGNGKYGINLSTFETTSGAVPETFTIPIHANKTFYGSTSDVLLLTVYPIQAQIGLNSTLIQVQYGHSFSIRANYSTLATNQSISGAICNVTWPSYYEISSIDDDFLITFNTTGLPIDVYIALIQISHLDYETSLKTVLVVISPISAKVGANISIVEVDFGDQFHIKVNYTEETTNKFIANATCTVTWDSDYNLTRIGNEFLITFNTTGLLLDAYTAIIQMEHPIYITAFKVISIIVKPIESEISILNPIPIKFTKGDIVNLSCQFLANNQPVLNATLTLLGDISGEFHWNGTLYYITINTSALTAKTYFTQIMGIKQNFEIQIKDNIFEIATLNLQIQASATTITYQQDTSGYFYVSILDISHNISRTDLNVTYSYKTKIGPLVLQPNGSYLLSLSELNLPPSTLPHQIDIIVSNPFGDDVILQINVIVPVEETDYSVLIWILVGIVVAVSGTFFGLFVKSRYLNLTKFQRDIRKLKNQLSKKGVFDTIKEPNRDGLIDQLFNQEFSIDKKFQKLKNNKLVEG